MEKIFCAHRGVSAHIPENTLPAFAAALALGADEIEFDIRLTKDKKLVISHDDNLERISDGKGYIRDYTMEELKKLNIGREHGWRISFCEAKDVFELLANKIVFNMHVKESGENGYLISELAKLVKEYNAEDNCYFAAVEPELVVMEKIAPQIKRCAIQHPEQNIGIFELAKKCNCFRVQFWTGMFDKELIDKLHGENIVCNLFHAETAEEFDTYFDMGIDNILTNHMDIAACYVPKIPEN